MLGSKRNLLILPLMFLALVLSACNQTTDPVVSPLTSFASPLVLSESENQAQVEIPKPGQETGVIVARIFSETLGDYLPGITIYLGEILPLEPGSDYLVTLSEQASPHVQANDAGYVVFDSVEPGEYALVLWSPIGSVVIPDFDNAEKELRVTIEAQEVVNFGEIQVEWP